MTLDDFAFEIYAAFALVLALAAVVAHVWLRVL